MSASPTTPVVDEHGITILDPNIAPRQATPTPPPEAEVTVVEETPVPTRTKVRALFITYDETVFDEQSLSAQRYAGYSNFYEEVHIIVPTQSVYAFDGMQLAPNVWAYPTHSTKWWLYPYDVYKTAERQLFFGGEFRPDVVVSDDPFELAGMAWIIARRWKRALVVGASELLYDESFLDESDDNGYRAWVGRFVMPRAERIIAQSAHVRDVVVANNALLAPKIDVVVRGYDMSLYGGIEAISPALKAKYAQYTFVMMMAAPLQASSGIAFVIQAASFTLRQYKTVALIIVGDGPERATLQALVAEKGIASNVFFEPTPQNIASYIRSAHVLLMPRRVPHSEEVLHIAALMKVPVIISEQVADHDVFVNDESAVVCKVDDIGCTIKALATYLNDSMLRQRFANEAGRRAHEHMLKERESGGALLASLKEAIFAYYDTEDRVVAGAARITFK